MQRIVDDGLFEAALARELIERTRTDVAAMRAALASRDLATIERLAHRLHGAAGALLLDALCEAAHRLQGACRAGRTDALSSLIDAVEAALPRASRTRQE